ncbi:hypothetical protein C943_03790 [Mariniradius saccharolyticus AK6]|jgi:hypothetical protein|uniref:Lipoprotein n=2 Tax=Mariniradius TaxID=1245590 RepID=M7XAW3_9BACT|nr:MULTISPECIES: hypothetical protein [Mariniradius]EMS34570.1 hypothetical protein C943_03790 [Mariniradius saccharolyticus AK6]MCF1753032.1 hypothetical protein [Mariniradius sediminis]
MKAYHPISRLSVWVLGALFAFSCTETEDQLPMEDAAVLQENAEVEAAYEDADMLTLSAMQSNGFSFRSQLDLRNDLCNTTKVDFYPNNRAIVINFGEGCTSPKGVNRKGKIMIYFSALSLESGTEVLITFDGYEVNGLKIEGRRKIINRGFNAEGKYFLFETLIAAGKVTWPDGTFATLEGEFEKKLYLPNDERGFKVEVSGGAGGKTRLGVGFISIIEKPLTYFQSCTDKGNWTPSLGMVVLTVGGELSYTLDFGNGDCDKKATVTKDGKTLNINLD